MPEDEVILPTCCIKAGCYDYLLSVMEPVAATRENKLAEADHTSMTIKIVTHYGYRRAAESLLHELLHVIDYRWNIQKGDEDERRVSTTSEGLATIWRDNPDVMRWIGEGLVG